MRAFRLTERRPSPACLEIVVEGELDLAVSELLRRALERAAAAAYGRVVVDLEGCEFVDLSGLEILARAQARAAAGQEVLVCGARGQVRRLFALTGSPAPADRPSAPPLDGAGGPGPVSGTGSSSSATVFQVSAGGRGEPCT